MVNKLLVYPLIAALCVIIIIAIPSKSVAPSDAEAQLQRQYGASKHRADRGSSDVAGQVTVTQTSDVVHVHPAIKLAIPEPGSNKRDREGEYVDSTSRRDNGFSSLQVASRDTQQAAKDLEHPVLGSGIFQNPQTKRCSPTDPEGGNPTSWRKIYKPHFMTGLNETYSEHLAWYSCSRQKNMKEHYIGKSTEAEFTGGQEKLREIWPNCFDLPTPVNTTTDLRELLNNETFREKVRSMSFPGKREIRKPAVVRGNTFLNSFGLTLNPHLKPREPFVPLLITTFYKAKNRLKNCLEKLKSVDFIQDTILYIAMEGFTIEILEAMAEMMTYMYTRIYFIPIGLCSYNSKIYAGYDPEDFWLSKNFKINLSFLWIMNVMVNLKDFDYVAVVEDDMDAQPDFYLHHLVLSRYALSRPDIAAVMATTAGDYYDCSGLLLKHLRAELDDAEYDVCETNLLYLSRNVMPWGAGYKKDFFLRILNRYMRKGLLATVKKGRCRYDAVMNYVNGPGIYALYPLVSRCHGDPRYYMVQRQLFPSLHSCNHTHYKIISPEQQKEDIVIEDYGYDWKEPSPFPELQQPAA